MMRKFLFSLVLLALIILSVVVRAYADGAAAYIKPYMGTYYLKELELLSQLPRWRLLLPLKEFGGRWGPTGFLLVHWLEARFGEPNAFYALTASMVATGYIVAYLMFRSLLLAGLFGFALATTTFNYHVYTVSGSIITLPLMCFLFLFGFAQFKWLSLPRRSIWWACAAAGLGILLALSYEGWLDIVPLIWVITPVLIWYYLRHKDRDRAIRTAMMAAYVTALAVTYSLVKVRFGLDGLHPKGGEADLILTYGRAYPLLMAEDILSSFVTFFYTTVSTFFPPELFSFSLSSWVYGPAKIVELQEGYHPQATHLTHYNHLFMWRYYAGFVLALFLVAYWRVLVRLWREPNSHYLTLIILMTATLIGSPTHLIIKWRPMHAAPFLGYQVYLSVVGFTLLLCYCVARYAQTRGGIRGYGLAALLAANFAYCAYARPALLSHMSQESFLGIYPDPRVNLRSIKSGPQQ